MWTGLKNLVENPSYYREYHAEYQRRSEPRNYESVDKPGAEHDNQRIDYENEQSQS